MFTLSLNKSTDFVYNYSNRFWIPVLNTYCMRHKEIFICLSMFLNGTG
jgi:hypothetical protein